MFDLNWDKILDEAKEYLVALVKINTTNPPGNEIFAAEYLMDILYKEGINSEIFESVKNRGSIITRIKGSDNLEPLLLLSHLDVVPAEENKWLYPPFTGKVIDNFIWGRGTLDCKDLVIQELMVLLLIKRLNIRLKRDIIFAATADEEKGGNFGLGYLIDNHFEKIASKYVINEGGGIGIPIKGKTFYILQTAEKGICWLRIKTFGSTGHASIPTDDNSVLYLSRIIDALSKKKEKIRITNTTEKMLKEVCSNLNIPFFLLKLSLNSFIFRILLKKIKRKRLKELAIAMLTNTLTPTVLKAGIKTNVIPSEAEAEIDCRILPGVKSDDIIENLKTYLKEFKFEINTIDTSLATESPYDTPLYSAIYQSLKNIDKNAVLLPFMQTGATDSRFLRKKDIICYGFSPYKLEGNYDDFLSMIHGHNEKISLENLLFGIRVLFDIVLRFCTNDYVKPNSRYKHL